MLRHYFAAVLTVSLLAILMPSVAQAQYVTSDVTVNTDPGTNTAVVNYTPPVATDDGFLPGAPPSCLPAPGSTFSLGSTPVTCNGMAQMVMCVGPPPCVPMFLPMPESGLFNVIVKDAEAPSIGDFPDLTTATAAGGSTAAADYAVPVATDNVGVSSVNCTPAPGSQIPVGTTDVTCTASDAAGNTATKVMHATVTATPLELPVTTQDTTPTPGSTPTPTSTTTPATTSKPSCKVPKLVGQKLATAKRRLAAAHCALGRVTRRRGGKRGIVRKQSLRAGKQKPAKTKVNLTISR